jgi:hypothetical protein
VTPYLRREPVAIAVSIAVAGVGLTVLAGWLSGSAELTRLYLPGPTVKTNTAIALACGGIANALLIRNRRESWEVKVAVLLAAAVTAIGLLTAFEHLVQRDLGIDQLFATEAPGGTCLRRAATRSPSPTMAPQRSGQRQPFIRPWRCSTSACRG